ncbi:hypothetical protein GHT07_08430 [Caenimonas koreensis DSM 17982]|uniref:Uncharacterized protein n=1 Tax=Caenimonas koreensis DSM 17982 TaxID=1121255 RepID=A0A844AT77_9BURK|nr:hypothetical protein [Caenimonas koreensis]MRD47304.1 hypothetical protein [Caenimonas koreensis DSM 17982]
MPSICCLNFSFRPRTAPNQPPNHPLNQPPNDQQTATAAPPEHAQPMPSPVEEHAEILPAQPQSSVVDGRLGHMYGLNLHVSEALKSQDLCDQIQGVHAGAWFEFGDKGLIKARYDAKENEIVMFRGPCAVTLKLSPDKTHVTGLIGQPAVSQAELEQFDIDGILNWNALRIAIGRVAPTCLDEPQPESSRAVRPDDPDSPQLGGRSASNFNWQPPVAGPSSAQRAVPDSGPGAHIVSLAQPLPVEQVIAAPALRNRAVTRNVLVVDEPSARAGHTIFGWFNLDKNALCVLDGPELNRSLFNLNKAGDRVVSITTDLPPLAGIPRLENLGIIYRGVCPSS